MKQWQIGLLLAFLLPALHACSDTPTSSSSSTQTGTLKGRLTRVYDRDFKYPTDMSGVTVTLDGAGFSAVTDSTGHWTIDNLPTRTYDITYSKTGYGSIHQYGFQFVGGDTVYMGNIGITMEPVTEVSVTSLQARIVDTLRGEPDLQISVLPSVTTTQQEITTLFIMISESPSSSIDNRAGTWNFASTYAVNRSSNLNIALDELYNRTGLQSGETAYITAYSVSGPYTVPAKDDLTVYASRSAAATTSIVIP